MELYLPPAAYPPRKGYVDACRPLLYDGLKRESVEPFVWNVSFRDEPSLVEHSIVVHGLIEPVRLLRVLNLLRPNPEYWYLDALWRSLHWQLIDKSGREVDPIETGLLKRATKALKTKRFHNGKPCSEAIPELLLARALTESKWPKLIKPEDNPAGFINQSTRWIFDREYRSEEAVSFGVEELELDPRSYRSRRQFEFDHDVAAVFIPMRDDPKKETYSYFERVIRKVAFGGKTWADVAREEGFPDTNNFHTWFKRKHADELQSIQRELRPYHLAACKPIDEAGYFRSPARKNGPANCP